MTSKGRSWECCILHLQNTLVAKLISLLVGNSVFFSFRGGIWHPWIPTFVARAGCSAGVNWHGHGLRAVSTWESPNAFVIPGVHVFAWFLWSTFGLSLQRQLFLLFGYSCCLLIIPEKSHVLRFLWNLLPGRMCPCARLPEDLKSSFYGGFF